MKQFEDKINVKFEELFPIKKVKIFPKDKPWINDNIKALDKAKKKEYRKAGKSERWKALQKDFTTTLNKQKRKYIKKEVIALEQVDPAKASNNLKNIAKQNDKKGEAFTLNNHINDVLNETQQREAILKHFSAISQEYEPIKLENLSLETQNRIISNEGFEKAPEISAMYLYHNMKKGKTTFSSVPGELPARLRNEAFPWFSEPAAIILRAIAKSGKWPDQFLIEYGSPIPKTSYNPEDENDLRVISITNKLSMVYERILLSWMWPFISKKNRRDQFGAMSKHQVNHYLIEVTNTILFNQDLLIPHTTLINILDYSKGFNRINHNIILEHLNECDVPGWLMRIMMGYLSERKLKIHFKDGVSESASLPGGGGQGTLLGLWMFLLSVNAAGFSNESKINERIYQGKVNSLTRKPIKNSANKWIDDSTTAHVINMLEDLEKMAESELIRPVVHQERFENKLKAEHGAQNEINQVEEQADLNQMVLNEKKTKVMFFNQCVEKDLLPRIRTRNETLEVVKEAKILGFIFTDDLKTITNTNALVKKGFSKLWNIRRLSNFQCDEKVMIKCMKQQIVPVMEHAAVYWHHLITRKEENMIENVIKVTLKTILGDKYLNYGNALLIAKMKTMRERREEAVVKFAVEAIDIPNLQSGLKQQLRNQGKPEVSQTLSRMCPAGRPDMRNLPSLA